MKRSFLILLLILSIPLAGIAQEFPPKPDPPRLVNDYTKTLSEQERGALENKLVNYYDSTSTQIAIVMISSLGGYPIDDYAIRLGELWGIGTKGKDNGVLIFVARDDRKIFIPTGYGMEGVLTDGLVKRIIENDIKPSFRENRYYEGFDKATDSIIRLAAGEHVYDEKPQSPVPFIAGFIIFLLFMVLIIVVSVKKAKSYAHINNIPFWTAWQILNQARRTHRGSWGGFTGGNGGWGGSSGGGFGGFGGGSFGGGGAGGSW